MKAHVGFLAALTLAALALPGLPGAAEGEIPCSDTSLPTVGCPDLIVDVRDMRDAFRETRTFAATSCAVVEGMTQAGTRTLVRFTFTTPNVGTGDLKVGRPADHPDWFVFSSCHNHFHFRQYADYRLWTREGYANWTLLRAQNPTKNASVIMQENPWILSQFKAGNKAGFCVIDLVQTIPATPRQYLSCSNNQGISVGWADKYVWQLDGQWVDVTGVAPGNYVLEAEVNAERMYEEKNYLNNAAAIPFALT